MRKQLCISNVFISSIRSYSQIIKEENAYILPKILQRQSISNSN